MADKKAQNIIIVKKKVSGHGGHHGGAWKVAYADFVTAMMCFFLVMWLMGSDDETKAMVAHYFNHPSTPWKDGRDPQSSDTRPLGEMIGAGDNLLVGRDGAMPDDLAPNPQRPQVNPEEAYETLEKDLREALEGRIFGVDLTKDYLRFSIPEEVLFPAREAQLKREALSLLDRVGRVLKPWRGTLTIEGHVDSDAKSIGNYSSSYEFTLARSVAVMRHLVTRRWLGEDRILPLGSGDRKAYSSNATESGREKNRRIDFVLTRSESATF